TMVLPAAYAYANELAQGAAHAKAAGVGTVPQIAAADRLGKLIVALEDSRGTLGEIVARAESSHESPDDCARLLTSEGAEAMSAVRAAADVLELALPDDHWPLPKYREMLFPV